MTNTQAVTRVGHRGGIGRRLFLSHLLVSVIGTAALLLGVSYIAPLAFDRSMMGMMGLGQMMGGASQHMSDAMRADVAVSFREALSSSLALASIAGVLASVVAGYLVSRRIVAPLGQLVRASDRIARGHYSERVRAEGEDELALLGESFNRMAASLEEVERRRLMLIGDVAHELRTPLATLEGYAEGLMDGVLEATPETFALLHSEARRLRRLVDDLQELSRAEARQITIRARRVSPVDLVETALSRLRPQFDDKGVALRVQVPDSIPDVLADEDRTVQVLTNLLGNALRYTPAGGQVTASCRTAGDSVEFSIVDTGIGIEDVHLPHLFERFYRVDRSRSRAQGGTGIGLTIARHLVEAQGGVIWAESPGPGQGSTFTFTLPFAH